MVCCAGRCMDLIPRAEHEVGRMRLSMELAHLGRGGNLGRSPPPPPGDGSRGVEPVLVSTHCMHTVCKISIVEILQQIGFRIEGEAYTLSLGDADAPSRGG